MLRAEAVPLTATALATGYRTRGKPRIITRTSFRIEPGTVAAVLGTNGSGKTTLLKTLVGLLPPVSGIVTLGPSSVGEHRARYGIGYLPEVLTFNAAWTVRDLLQLTAFSACVADDVLPEACRLAGIDYPLALEVRVLSKGMRQRVGLAMALIPVPALLLLDEPEAGLDPAQRIRLRHHIRELADSGCVVVIASHDLSGICSVADRKFVLNDGMMSPVSNEELSDPRELMRLFAGGAA